MNDWKKGIRFALVLVDAIAAFLRVVLPTVNAMKMLASPSALILLLGTVWKFLRSLGR